MTDLLLDAPIVAVAVYPDRARITRRGTARVPAGDQRVLVEPLPLGLEPDSVRVAGRGPATVLGVDVAPRHHARTPDTAVAALEEERRTIWAEIAEIVDADGVQVQLTTFLDQLARRAGGSYARSIAAGDTTPDSLGGFTDSLAGRLAEVQTRRRELTEKRRLVDDRLAATERRLATVSAQSTPDRLTAMVTLTAEQESDVELELSYVVTGAGWSSAYDVRLIEDRLTLSWYGLVSQHTGEDWPECDLTLSTARPATAAKVPELDPWFLDRLRPPVPGGRKAMLRPAAPAAAVAGSARSAAEFAVADLDVAMDEAVATTEQGVTAASYRPARPVAVPADGAAHRATVAAIDLDAELDYVTAPVRSPEAHLRATVVNSSTHTLPAGKAAVFHGGDFVGSAALAVWAPGEEVELALGVDDRIRVERELVRRTATKATLGSTRRREVEYTTTVTNHTPRPARVSVLDQVPVSRDEQIAVKSVSLDPEPAERTDLGVVTWKLDLDPGASAEVRLGIRLETGKGVELSGWRE